MEHEWLPGTLTERQKEVLRLIAEDLSADQIAYRLDMNPETVEFLKDLLRKKRGQVHAAGPMRFGYVAPA